MRWFLVALLVIHGLIHGLGFVKAFDLAAVPQLVQPISRPAGALWLVAGLLCLVAAAALAAGAGWAVVPLGLAVVLSQALVFLSFRDAFAGTLPNIVLGLAAILLALSLRPASLRSSFLRALDAAERRPPPAAALVSETDLAPLPPSVQRYLRVTGAVGQPRVHSVHARFRGRIRNGFDGAWRPFFADQRNALAPAERLFLMNAAPFGRPRATRAPLISFFDALHEYREGVATMRVQVLSALTVVDARGPQMNQSETVTFLNDLCVLAPAALIDPRLSWENIDDRRARATLALGGQRVSAELLFNDAGELVSFASTDRFLSADGKRFEALPWVTPLRDYRSFGPRRVSTRGDAMWKTAQGDFVYGEFELLDIRYNEP